VAITHDASAFDVNGTAGASFSHTLGAASGNNRLVIVGVCGESNKDTDSVVTSATYNGVAGTQIGTVVSPDPGTVRATLYYWLDADLPASAGTYTVTVSTVKSDETGCVCSSYTGVKQQAAEATNSAESETGRASFSTNITTLSANALVYDTASVFLSAGSGAPTSPQVERMDGNNNVLTALASDKIVASAGSTSMGWTLSGTDVRDAHFLAAFAPAPTGNTFFGISP
jgi:hypothetical protein